MLANRTSVPAFDLLLSRADSRICRYMPVCRLRGLFGTTYRPRGFLDHSGAHSRLRWPSTPSRRCCSGLRFRSGLDLGRTTPPLRGRHRYLSRDLGQRSDLRRSTTTSRRSSLRLGRRRMCQRQAERFSCSPDGVQGSDSSLLSCRHANGV